MKEGKNMAIMGMGNYNNVYENKYISSKKETTQKEDVTETTDSKSENTTER